MFSKNRRIVTLNGWILRLELWIPSWRSKMWAFLQCFGSGFVESGYGYKILGWIPIRIHKLEKIYGWKFFFLFFFIKNCNLRIPRPPKRTSKLQEKPSALKREHPHFFQNMKFLDFFSYFCGSFFLSWIRISHPDTDPLNWLNPDQIRIRIRIRNTDYNPDHIHNEALKSFVGIWVRRRCSDRERGTPSCSWSSRRRTRMTTFRSMKTRQVSLSLPFSFCDLYSDENLEFLEWVWNLFVFFSCKFME